MDLSQSGGSKTRKGAVGGTPEARRGLLRLWMWWAGKEDSLAALSWEAGDTKFQLGH